VAIGRPVVLLTLAQFRQTFGSLAQGSAYRRTFRFGTRKGKVVRVLRLTVVLAVACEILLTGALNTSAAATTIAANWTQSGYNARHTGYNPLETTLTRSNVAHLVRAFTTADFENAIVVNGVAYAGASEKGLVQAINATSGAVNWTVSPCGAGEATSAPAFSAGRIWVTLAGGGSFGNGIAGLDSSGTNFACLHTVDSFSGTPPTATNSTVYAGGNGGQLVAINASTGNLRWSVKLASEFLESPAVSSDGLSLFVATRSGHLYKINAATGATIWKRTADSLGTVTVSGSTLYLGGYGALYALSASTGSVLWEAGFPGFFCCITAPTVANGLVFAGDEDGGTITGVSAFNATTGKMIWNQSVGDGEQFSSVTVANGVVYVTTDGGNLEALNSSTGVPLAFIRPPSGIVFNGFDLGFGQPTVVNGMVYVGALTTSTNAPLLVALKL
jgi:outer membrane protein assembly factor BamB